MTTSMLIAPPNSLVLIADSQGGTVPISIAASRVASTDSCIAIGCQAEMDGETEITMGPASQVDPGVSPAFDGVIETPNHIVVVWTIEWQKLLHASVPTSRTRVRVWRNHPREPNEVIIGLG